MLPIYIILPFLQLAFAACNKDVDDGPCSHELEGTNVVAYQPPPNFGDPKVTYARLLQLKSGDLLATCERDRGNMPEFPIFDSRDEGKSWTQISSVADTKNHWGNRFEPFLFQLHSALGDLPVDTVILAGNSVPADHGHTQLNMYASPDEGRTWNFLSTIASGGRAEPNNGETPVWEPFLLQVGDTLICYYSSQRDPEHGQKIVHQTSTDGITWSDPVDDVASPVYRHRPGMPVVARIGDGRFIMTYEFFGAPEANFAVYYKIAKDPYSFGSVIGRPVKPEGHSVPTSSPYVVWTPYGSDKGTIVVSSGASSALFTLRGSGEGQWTQFATNVPAGYSRSLIATRNGVIIAGAGPLDGKGGENKLVVSRIRFQFRFL